MTDWDNGMRESRRHLDCAVRVLTALTQDRYPNPDDVAQLRRFAPDAADKSIDELVVEVIRNVLKRNDASSSTR